MNNPGIDLQLWEQLRKKWSNLNKSGHKVQIDFKLIADPLDENKILIIDVIQNIDNEVITETVAKSTEEMYAALGIEKLSVEQLVEIYKKQLHNLYRDEGGKRDEILIVTMTPTSLTSGVVVGTLQKPASDVKSTVIVNYTHYCILNALREKMVEVLSDNWSKVKVTYKLNELEFYFEYS